MGFKRFSIIIALRTILIMLTLVLLSYLIVIPGYYASTLLIITIFMIQSVTLYRFILKTNNELTRFFDAARYADYSQRFELQELGAGFGELGKTFTDILKRFRENSAEKEEEFRHLKALIEHAPVPLVSLHADGRVSLWNNSARRLFCSNTITHIDNLADFGDEFSKQVQSINIGERRLITLEIDSMQQRLVISATQIIIAGEKERILSLQDIQSELDSAQLEAWQDLVRVLTHEIMNSITPVASLAKTAADLLNDVKSKLADSSELEDELNDASSAVNTVARRSDGLMKFVSSYKKLTRLPTLNKKSIKLNKLLTQVSKIFNQRWEEKNIELKIRVTPPELEFTVDVDMIEQVLINLLKNAEQAVENKVDPKIEITSSLNKRGHVALEVFDNGDGIQDELVQKIFVPFFTTKREGSGVGLALTRQVMIAHNGNVTLKESPLNGACFRLTF